jgi:hypothetical protein
MNNRVNSCEDLAIYAWYTIKIDEDKYPVIGQYVGNYEGFLKFLRYDFMNSIFSLPEEWFDHMIIEKIVRSE